MRLSTLALVVACVAAPAGLAVTSNSPTAQAAAMYRDQVHTGKAGKFSVVAASTVTNTGSSTLSRSLGLYPGTSVTGFPPGVVLAPGTIEVANAAAQEAQASVSSAYNSGANRALTGTVPADLAGQTLGSGVYAASGKGALSLNGTLVLDAGWDTGAVFIFQTSSTLTTGSGSSVSLINGAQGCRVFWIVGSSATLGTGSSFVGTILAQASITVTTGASVRGRALARTGAVTLDSNVFTPGSCQAPNNSPTGTTPGAGPAVPAVPVVPAAQATTTTTVPDFPATGSDLGPLVMLATILVAVGVSAAIISRRRRIGVDTG